MARRVRFLTLTLAGFGRYDRPTRFDLAGRAVTFTSPNELGKSTFLSGLLAAWFGPPTIKSKAAAFQSRHRSWTNPKEFWGEIEFTVADERWRVRHDFDELDVKVWRIGRGGDAELRYETNLRAAAKDGESDAYARYLQDWIGLTDRSLYEAMFTVSQESTVAADWRIDPRIASLVYGPTVERLAANLQQLHGRFREITRNTREHGIVLGPQGARDGRTDGRLEEVLGRNAQLETALAAARLRTETIATNRLQLADAESQCEQLRARHGETKRSYENWHAWVELESRLRPAVEEYERLRDLNDRSQQLTRPLAELRARLAADTALFDQAPVDLNERLEYLPLLEQEASEAGRKHHEATVRIEPVRQEIELARERLAGEFSDVRDRPQLADQVEELRLVREEIDRLRAQLAEFVDVEQNGAAARLPLECELAQLNSWRRLAGDSDLRLSSARGCIEEFRRDHAEFEATAAVVRDEEAWIDERAKRLEHLEADRAALEQSRGREQSAIEAGIQAIRLQIAAARAGHVEVEQARGDIDRRFVDFRHTPPNLLERWDQLHAVESEHADVRRGIERTHDARTAIDRRRYWRRGLTGMGATILATQLWWARGGFDWLLTTATVAITATAQWLYRHDKTGVDQVQQDRERLDAESARIARTRSDLIHEIGADLIVPPEREAEWRRLWPAYQRELDELRSRAAAIPDDDAIANMDRTVGDESARLARFEADSAELFDESATAIEHARAERERRERELERLRDRAAAHTERHFQAAPSAWQSQPIESLPSSWAGVLAIADAAGAPAATSGDLVRWCETIDDGAWRRFADSSRRFSELDAKLAALTEPAESPEKVAVRIRVALAELEPQAAELEQAIVPFTAESEPAWLRDRLAAWRAAEDEIVARELELVDGPNLVALAADADLAMCAHTDARAALVPYLERFGNDPSQVAAAIGDRTTIESQLRDHERQAAEFLAGCGFSGFEDLAHEAGKAEGLVATVRTSSRELLDRAPELWAAVDAPPELPTQRVGELQSQLDELQAALDAAERSRAELAATIRQLEADPATDSDAIASQLESQRAEQRNLEADRDRIAAEFQEANRLKQELERVERSALEGRITAYFADFSRTTGRRVELDEELHIAVLNEDGTRYLPDQLSHGARDQLWLAVYLAATVGFDLPFVLDDPFVNCDAERLAAIRSCWDRLIPDHQLILLSHDPQLASWAPALEMRAAA